jgi:hypothetical protein
MEVRQYIVAKNLDGVKSWAAKSGYPVPADANSAYELLTRIYKENPLQAQVIFKELHPDGFLFAGQNAASGNSGGQLVYMNKSTKSDFFAADGCGSMRNADGCGCGCGGNCGCKGNCRCGSGMRNATGDMNTSGLMQYAEQGVSNAKDLFIDISKEIKESAKERDDRIFKYGAVLIIGFLAGKYIFK